MGLYRKNRVINFFPYLEMAIEKKKEQKDDFYATHITFSIND